uniref:Uncharacterized protein n=1 Tax=Tanacetum cinerariifolium TaxID=118510 RepID=A0A6L2P6K6_TANCI|nr:hypothetical protein [Tanacetum cinerariifolium]
MGHGLAHGSANGLAYGSALVDKDDSLVEEMSPVKAKKPLKLASKAKRVIPRIMSHQKTGQRPKRSCCVELDAMCQKMPRKETNYKSGSCDLNVYPKACAKYKLMYRHDFTLEACSNLLKDHQGWLVVEMPSVYKNTKGRKKSKTFEITSGSAYGDFNLDNEADESEEETQQHRSMGPDHSKAKKKSSGSSHEGSSSFVDLVDDKFFNIKAKK